MARYRPDFGSIQQQFRFRNPDLAEREAQPYLFGVVVDSDEEHDALIAALKSVHQRHSFVPENLTESGENEDDGLDALVLVIPFVRESA